MTGLSAIARWPVIGVLLGAAAVSIPAGAGAAATDTTPKPVVACEDLGDDPIFGRLPICIHSQRYHRDVCDAIDLLSQRNTLPAGFFARLIWQESRFDPNAVSPKGALGIAQFMPGTARLRGLQNAFNPADALAKSATYLREMQLRYGNLGLAAVGYNAGERRVEQLLDAGATVPAETERYVFEITGLPVGAWVDAKPKTIDYALEDGKPFRDACIRLAETERFEPMTAEAQWKPWGAEIGASFSPVIARRIFQEAKGDYPDVLGGETPMLVRSRNLSFGSRARYTVRIGRDSRAAAAKLCARIAGKGGYCVVREN
jgi:hypothetical protein